MPTVYITDEDSSLVKRGKRLVINKYDTKVADVPLLKVNQVVIFGNATLTTPMINTFLKCEIPVTFLSYRGNFRGRLMPEFSKNSILRKEQYKASEDRLVRLDLAKHFVAGKVNNARAILLRGTRENRSREEGKIIEKLKQLVDKIWQAEDLDQLRGYEGLAGKKYYQVFSNLLSDEFSFSRRTRRPPKDEANALLSFGYMLLYSEVFNIVNMIGYDPYIGYLHHDKYGKPSLVLDLMEEFRAIIDNLVKRIINRGVINKDEFKEKYGGFELKESSLELFLKKFEQKMSSKFTHPQFDYEVDFRETIELQARLLSKKLTGEVKDYNPFEVK